MTPLPVKSANSTREVRMTARRSLIVAALALLAPSIQPAQTPSAGALRMPRIFNDGMVLQRGESIRLWGWATPGAPVVARLSEAASARTSADASGRWTLNLPRHAAGGPVRL